MSDTSIAIVPKKSSYPNNVEKADEILKWLISRDIVKETLHNCPFCVGGFKSEVQHPEFQ
jgi:hypothetical protein